MEEMAFLLDELESKLRATKRLPAGVMPILERMRSALEDEKLAAEQTAREGERALAQAQEKAERIVALAREEAEQAVAEHEIVQAAKAQAEAVRQEAATEAESILSGADEYAFEVLCELEQELNRTLTVIANGLRALQDKRAERAPQATPPLEEPQSQPDPEKP